jgi:hypothetical protein
LDDLMVDDRGSIVSMCSWSWNWNSILGLDFDLIFWILDFWFEN